MALPPNFKFNFVNRTDLLYCGIIPQQGDIHGDGIIDRIRVHLSSNDYLLLIAEISIILIISLCIQTILRPFKQPRVISDMIAGLIVGPSFLGQSKVFNTLLFPERSKYMLQSMTQMAMIFFFFINGIQMDVTMLWKARRRAYFIGLIGVFIPIIIMTIAFDVQKDSLHMREFSAARFKVTTSLITASVSVTSLHVLYPLLKELNLLATDVGRLSISCCMISDIVGFFGTIMSGIARQTNTLSRFGYVISYFGIIFFCFAVLRPVARLVNRKTPYGSPVKNFYMMMFLLGIMLTAFLADFLGSSIMQGPVFFALAIPEGPPLGAALVKKTEAVMANIFMPILFAQAGLICDLSSTAGLPATKALIIVVVIGYFAKFLTTIVASLFFKMPIRDAVSLGLVMSFRAQTELSGLLRWKYTKMIGQSIFTVLFICTIVVTSISTLLLRFIYIPTLSYMTKKPRTILHMGPNAKLNIVACVHNQENVPALLDLLKVSNPTEDSPISVYVLQLVELIGKYRLVFINHNGAKNNNKDEYSSKVIWKAFEMYKQVIGNEFISFNFFTIVSPYKIMYHEICKFALDKKATMIILPIHNGYDGGEQPLRSTTATSTYRASQLVNTDVMSHAPCSIGFLVSRDLQRNVLLCDSTNGGHSTMRMYRVIVLFLGGADAREALAYADLMANQKNVSITVIRFWAVNSKDEESKQQQQQQVVDDNEEFDHMEGRLDQECFSWFVTKNLANDSIDFMDIEVNDGVELIEAIRRIDRHDYDLWMVGKGRGINPVFVQGLSKEDWMIGDIDDDTTNHPELGVFGDFIASPDFEGSFSVLVIQQQLQDKM